MKDTELREIDAQVHCEVMGIVWDESRCRGCGWPMRRPPFIVPRPSSKQIFGNCVVLPEPVSPQTITTWLDRSAAMMTSR